MGYNIDKTYGVPKEDISCPSCGQRYGHHNTLVDANSQECSKCAKEQNYKKQNLMSACIFITTVLGYHPL